MTTVNRNTWLGLMRADEVLDLRDGAATAGDLAMVAICDEALDCDLKAQEKVLAVIAAAEAMVD